MRLKVLKYDKQKARSNFILFKLAELLGLFLFVFGFHGLGSIVYNSFPKLYDSIVGSMSTNYLATWFVGFSTIILGIFGILIIYGCLYVVCKIIKTWIKANWRWAKEAAEDEGYKIERLSEQKKLKEVERIESDRKSLGYCVGDKIKYKEARDYPCSCHAPNGAYGKKATLRKVYPSGSFRVKEFNEEGNCKEKEIEKVVQKIDITKKPKLNKVREEEVKDKEKKND